LQASFLGALIILLKITPTHQKKEAATMKQFGKSKTLLQLIDRKQFDELCVKWEMDKGIRKFSTWEQTCTHIMSYVMRLESLREIEAVLFVPRSTFSDANAKRSAGFFEELCMVVLKQIQAVGGRKIKRAIKALDSTHCHVHGSVANYPLWRDKKAHEKKAHAKLHCIWNIEGEWIEDFRITPGSNGDSPVASQFKISSESTYVFDRAYNDLNFWWKIVQSKAHFVSRLKECPARRIQKKLLLERSQDKTGVLWDGEYKPIPKTLNRCPNVPKDIQFRQIIYRDPESKKIFDFITSDYKADAQEIADIYRKRWAVELLFRWLKGHLHIRYFAAKNRNCVKIQMVIAVIVQLLVQLYRIQNKFKGTLWECLRAIRIKLVQQSVEISGLQDYDRWKPLPDNGLTF
jgi:Transposase DDE domain/Domain of unknown function (DUF4372)